MQEQIDYKDLIDLGFEREDASDNVFFNQNGYGWFWLELKLAKKIVAHWEQPEKTVELRRMGKNGTILSSLPVKNLEQLERWI